MDPYTSRQAPKWEIAERQDPVLWKPSASGPLSTEHLESFQRNGFLIMKGLFSETEAETWVAEAHRMAQEADPSREDIISEPDNDTIRTVFRVHEQNARFKELVNDPRLRDAARQILGSDVYVHQSRVNFKPGFTGREFYWHSDFETWHIEDGMPRMRALSASILLTENVPVNGPLMLVPGSHKRYVRCVGETPRDHYKQSLKKQDIGVPDPDALTQLVADGGIEQALGPAGTVVLFDCNTMHGSVGNLSPFARHNVFLVYNSVENRLVEPFGGTPPRPAFLAAR